MQVLSIINTQQKQQNFNGSVKIKGSIPKALQNAGVGDRQINYVTNLIANPAKGLQSLANLLGLDITVYARSIKPKNGFFSHGESSFIVTMKNDAEHEERDFLTPQTNIMTIKNGRSNTPAQKDILVAFKTMVNEILDKTTQRT